MLEYRAEVMKDLINTETQSKSKSQYTDAELRILERQVGEKTRTYNSVHSQCVVEINRFHAERIEEFKSALIKFVQFSTDHENQTSLIWQKVCASIVWGVTDND
eukprot:TRINITY_DN4863_c0_g1_i1.p1 TRINITY_DN4863_c0_g1~~TRINITY_DN4863_c0_g1_i1.p1  ORF type:complete len:104 (-),score=19.44 TRINITY_DN4863_c0_g1_i1:221-532(-)